MLEHACYVVCVCWSGRLWWRGWWIESTTTPVLCSTLCWRTSTAMATTTFHGMRTMRRHWVINRPSRHCPSVILARSSCARIRLRWELRCVSFCDLFSRWQWKPRDTFSVRQPSLFFGFALCCAVLHCTVLHCTALCCTALYCTALCCTVLHCAVLSYAALHCAALHCAALCCAALHCAVLHCAVLHCTALCCTALCCTAQEPVSQCIWI